jgi:hypothetical protein
MEAMYSNHLFGPQVSSLPTLPFVEYNPNNALASKQASDAALKTYLTDTTNRQAYNQSFQGIKTDFYNNGERVGYVIPDSNQVISLPGANINNDIFYNQSKFSQDIINDLNYRNTDFANYIIKDTPIGTNLENIVNESGEMISVDPSYSQSTMTQFGFGAILAGLSLPAIGYGIRNIVTGDKNEKALGVTQVGLGGFFNYWFGKNMVNSISHYSSPNMATSLLGMKGLCFNSGMFLIGNGIYNLFSSFKDYKRDPTNKGMHLSKTLFGGLEIASGSFFVSAGTKTMTSLIYEGSGLFSLSTQGLSSILATTIPWGIGLGVAALVTGAVYLTKWYKNKKNKATKWLG